jgi:hypothetical protein
MMSSLFLACLAGRTRICGHCQRAVAVRRDRMDELVHWSLGRAKTFEYARTIVGECGAGA